MGIIIIIIIIIKGVYRHLTRLIFKIMTTLESFDSTSFSPILGC